MGQMYPWIPLKTTVAMSVFTLSEAILAMIIVILTCMKINFLIYTHGSLYEGIPDGFNKYTVPQITKPHIHTVYPKINKPE